MVEATNEPKFKGSDKVDVGRGIFSLSVRPIYTVVQKKRANFGGL